MSLVALPRAQLAKCRASLLLRPACPRRVPRISGRYRALFARDGKLVPALHVFDLEFFLASERPPKGAHVTAAAGAVRRLTPYAEPTERTRVVSLSTPIIDKRTKPVSYGVRNWNGRRGILYLAPPFLNGGQLGDHLVFQWKRAGRMYVVSLHVWSSPAESAPTLRAMVMALD